MHKTRWTASEHVEDGVTSAGISESECLCHSRRIKQTRGFRCGLVGAVPLYWTATRCNMDVLCLLAVWWVKSWRIRRCVS